MLSVIQTPTTESDAVAQSPGIQSLGRSESEQVSGAGSLLQLDDLGVSLMLEGARRPILHGVSLEIAQGEALGLVGESGSGKSMTARAVARLLPETAMVTGSVRFDGREVQSLKGPALRQYRSDVSVVFQDPRAHTNPVRRIGDFMTEALRVNKHVQEAEAKRQAIELLGAVGIDDGERRLRQYPHELSGGLLQRVMIATCLLTEPRLLLADEVVTALDVTSQAEVMAILDDLRHQRGLSMLFITHDLDLASAVCDRTAVMYAGLLVEVRASSKLHSDPLHPYTAALGAARPSIDRTARRLPAIPGRPLSASEAPTGCSFSDRCSWALDECRAERPPLVSIDDGLVRCFRAIELRGKLVGAE